MEGKADGLPAGTGTPYRAAPRNTEHHVINLNWDAPGATAPPLQGAPKRRAAPNPAPPLPSRPLNRAPSVSLPAQPEQPMADAAPVWWKMAVSRGLRCCQRAFAWLPVLIIALVVLWSYYAYVCELCLGERSAGRGGA